MTIEPARLRESHVLVVGDVMLDRYWHGDVDRVSPEAPVPVVRMTGEEFRLGGAANVARNVASLGAGCTLTGIIGDDEAAERVGTLLSAAGIRDELMRDAGAPTTVKLRINGRAQQLLRVDFESEPVERALDGLEGRFRERVAESSAVVLSDYGKGGLARVAAKISESRARGVPVLIDPKGHDYTPYRGATLITPNRAELAQVVGRWKSEAELADRVWRLRQELELDAILLTRSEEGMSLFDAGGKHDVSAEAREVYDVTGAGDTVIATMAALIGAGYSPREALPVANRAGGIVVGKFGAAAIEAGELFA